MQSCRAVSRKEVDRGILICGTGMGMCIVANKFADVRAAPLSRRPDSRNESTAQRRERALSLSRFTR
ncbi:MAG: RpiB/LacA/LacB family sugar-phosphate isomerase [Planctomycetaceae bacterium]